MGHGVEVKVAQGGLCGGDGLVVSGVVWVVGDGCVVLGRGWGEFRLNLCGVERVTPRYRTYVYLPR